jgi:hypothetical protein
VPTGDIVISWEMKRGRNQGGPSVSIRQDAQPYVRHTTIPHQMPTLLLPISPGFQPEIRRHPVFVFG